MFEKQSMIMLQEYHEIDAEKQVNTIPAHWEKVQLGDSKLFSFENGIWTGKIPPFVDYPILRNTNFTEFGTLNMSNIAIVPIEQRQLEKKRLKWGDIIIERSGGGPQQPVGRVAFFNQIDGNYCFSNFTSRLRIEDHTKVFSYYLHLYLLYLYFSGHTERLQNRTTGIRNLAFEDYKKSVIVLPPLPEQRAIAHTLQTVQHCTQARRKELALERERKAALMQHLFTYGTCIIPFAFKKIRFGNIPNHWDIQPLDQCAVVQTGLAKGRKLENNQLVILPYLRVANVQDGYLDLSEIKTIELRDIEVERYKLYPGDVLVTEGGDFDKLGRGFLWNGEIPECVHQNHIFAIRAHKDVLLPEYLAYLIQSTYGKAYFLSVAHKTTNLACINSSKLKAFPTLLPSLEEQQEIATILHACDSKIRALEKEIALQEELFRALLDELMTGRLSTLPLVEQKGHAACE